MPEFTGISNASRQIIYTHTQAPSFVYIEILNRPDLVNEKLGLAKIEFKRTSTAPYIQLYAGGVYGQGLLVRPGGYPGTGFNNRLVIDWLYQDLSWRVFF